MILVGVILSSLVIRLFYPAKGFTDWQLVKETELVTLSNSVASKGSGRDSQKGKRIVGKSC